MTFPSAAMNLFKRESVWLTTWMVAHWLKEVGQMSMSGTPLACFIIYLEMLYIPLYMATN